jgi:uncharacterized protein YfcZ (UPF0381/DUF406 family)
MRPCRYARLSRDAAHNKGDVGELRKERDEMAAQLKAFNAEVEEANKAAAAAEAKAKAAAAERSKVAGEASALHAEVARLKVPPPPCPPSPMHTNELTPTLTRTAHAHMHALVCIRGAAHSFNLANALAFSLLARHLSFSHKTNKQTNKPRVSRDCSTG